jgi:hypothetical protein
LDFLARKLLRIFWVKDRIEIVPALGYDPNRWGITVRAVKTSILEQPAFATRHHTG